MTYNPWQVESLEAFAYLKCPECPFDCKEDIFFQAHALENHPLSIAFFGQTTKIKEELPDSDIGKVIIEKSCGENQFISLLFVRIITKEYQKRYKTSVST